MTRGSTGTGLGTDSTGAVSVSRAPRPRSFLRRHRAVLVGSTLAVLTLALLVFGWSRVDDTTATFTSRPLDVWNAMTTWVTSPVHWGDIGTTLSEAGAGFLLAVAVATIAAVVISTSRFAADVLAPFVALANITPRVALAPVFLLVFGIGYISKLYFVGAVVVVIPFFALLRALMTIDPVFKDNARLLGGSRWQIAWDVYVPAVLGAMITSLRVSVSFALLSSVFIEIMSSNSGIGYEIAQAQLTFRPDEELAGIIVVALIGFIVDRLLLLLERRFSSWKVSA